MALPDFTTQDAATYKANIDGTASDHETRIGDVETDISALETGKQATITGAATTIDTEDLTASRALVSNASGKVAVSSVLSADLASVISGLTGLYVYAILVDSDGTLLSSPSGWTASAVNSNNYNVTPPSGASMTESNTMALAHGWDADKVHVTIIAGPLFRVTSTDWNAATSSFDNQASAFTLLVLSTVDLG